MLRRKTGETFEDYANRVIAAEFPVPAGETRYQRVYREQRQRRRLRELRMREEKRNRPKAKPAVYRETYEDRLDDTGLSPDV